MPQAKAIIDAIREAGKAGLTWGDIQARRISTCPWVRLMPESRPERFLRKGERIAVRIGSDGLMRRYITRARG